MAKAGSSAEEYDLTQTSAKFFDPHMLIPLIDFLKTKNMHTKEELAKAKLSVLMKTGMVDKAIETHKELKLDVPKELTARRDEAAATMATLREAAKPVLDLVADEEKVKELKAERSFNHTHVTQQLAIPPESIDAMYAYAKCVYESGDYAAATPLLAHVRALLSDADKSFSALWGKLASEILSQAFDAATEDIKSLQELIDARTSTPAAMQLQQRCWLMHWGLFLLGSATSGRSVVCDLFLQDKYLQAVQTNAPHLLRYLAVAVVTNPRRKDKMRELVRVIGIERASFTDPITMLLEDLHSKAAFDTAQARLVACSAALSADYFTASTEENFIKCARLQLFEAYCRIHQRIDLKMLAAKLGMEPIAAEKWIVSMVSDAQLNAKIDEVSGHVILGAQPPDVYQQVIEKTKGLSFRSYVLAQNIEKRAAAAAQ